MSHQKEVRALREWSVIGSGPIALTVAQNLCELSPGVVVLRSYRREVFSRYLSPRCELLEDLESLRDIPLKIIAIKAYSLKEVIPPLRGGSLILAMNGLDLISEVRSLGWEGPVAQGVVEFGARFEGERLYISGKPSIKLPLSFERYVPERLKRSKLWVFIDDDEHERERLMKAAMNSIINTLTALLEIRNGELKRYHRLLNKLCEELAVVSGLPKPLIVERLSVLLNSTSDNISSTLHDLLECKPLEVRWFAEPFTRRGAQKLERLLSALEVKRALRCSLLRGLGLTRQVTS